MTNVHMKFSLGIIISIVPKPGTCTRRWNCPRARNLNQRSGWLESKPGLRGQPVRGSRPLQFVWRGLAKPVLPSRESEFRLRLLLLLLLLSMLLHLWSTLLLLMDQLLWLDFSNLQFTVQDLVCNPMVANWKKHSY